MSDATARWLGHAPRGWEALVAGDPYSSPSHHPAVWDAFAATLPGYGVVRRDWSTTAWGEILVPGAEAGEARAVIADYLAALEHGGMVRDEDVEES